MENQTIYDWVKAEETAFQTDEVEVGDNWFWNFRKHVQLIFHLKNGIFFTGENDWLRCFKNIMEIILNLAYWTEDIEVKDVVFYIEEKAGRVLSFFVKKYHDEVYVKEHDLDTLFDEITESDLDYGGVLVQKGVDRPEVLQLNTVAFCDQTDILGGPQGLKFHFSPSKLRAMSDFGWGEEKNGATISLENLCLLANNQKDSDGTIGEKKNKVPGKTIEVYIVRGDMPESFLKEGGDSDYHCNQIQIIAYYTKKDSTKEGVTLYRKEDDGSIKFFTSKKVYGRALGRGVGEAIVPDQIWTNFLSIHKMNMLEAASKVPLYTDDPSYTQKNKIQDMENLEITTVEEGKSIHQVPTASPANLQLIEGSIEQLYVHSQNIGSAQDPILGVEGSSGTTFRGQERSVAQGRGIHDRRRGQRAKFIEEIYRDWIIPDMVKEIKKGKKFLASLSSEEMTWVADQLVTNQVNKKITDMILGGMMVPPEIQDELTLKYKQDFLKKGNKHLLEILSEELDGIEVKMGINIAGKQKNLANLSDKVLSIFQSAFANPQGFLQTIQIPGMGKAFEDILEYGGLNVSDFSALIQNHQIQPQPENTAQPQGIPSPVQPTPVTPAQ